MTLDFPHIHLILNPASGKGRGGRQARRILQHLAAIGVHVKEYVTGGRGHATDIARQLPDDNLPLLVLGGDGTLNEVINGLRARSHPVAVLPLGTGNDFARLMGLRTVEHALHAFANGTTRRVDAAVIDVVEEGGAVLRRRFINSMGIGFDAAVAVDVSRASFGSGILPYLLAVFRVLRHFASVTATMVYNNEEQASTLFLACIGNGTTSGGGFKLTPLASPDDGLLDLCHVRHVGTRRVLQVLPRAVNGSHLRAPEVHSARAAHYDIELDDPLPVHCDGEILTEHARRLIVHCLQHEHLFFHA